MAGNNDENVAKNFYSSAKNLIADRYSSPFLLSFIISWLIINYKIVIVAVSDITDTFTVDNKINLIASYLEDRCCYFNLFDRGFSLPTNGFLLPLLTALFFAFLYPAFGIILDFVQIMYKKTERNMRVNLESKFVVSGEDVLLERRENFEVNNALREQLSSKELELHETRQKLKEALSQDNSVSIANHDNFKDVIRPKQYSSKVIELADMLTKGALEAIIFFGDYRRENKVNSIDEASIPNKYKNEFKELLRNGLIREITNKKTLNKEYEWSDITFSVYQYLTSS